MSGHRPVAQWCLPRRVAYVVNHSLPYSSDGYAIRTHEVARALTENGHDMVVINRPGRPWDIEGFAERETVQTERIIDGVRYIFQPCPATKEMTPQARLDRIEAALFRTFETFRPSAVIGVSNWENAGPAKDAARRWNVPFYYEQRGFWEMTRAAREPGHDQTDAFETIREKETRVARAARAVFTLNASMRAELIRRGVEAARIHLVPNGISGIRIPPPPISRARIGSNSRYLLGYIGSISHYEGTQDLIGLLKRLRGQDIDVDLAFVGSSAPKGLVNCDWQPSETETALRREAVRSGLAEHVHFVARVPRDQVGSYYRMLDAMIMPRHRSAMTELVAPIKPYAAASHGTPVFMPDIPPLDEIAAEIGATLFPEGDLSALTGLVAAMLAGQPRKTPACLPNLAWKERVKPMSRLLKAARASLPGMSEMLGFTGAIRSWNAGDGSGFDTAALPQVRFIQKARQERIVAIGPCAWLGQTRRSTAGRANLLAALATGVPGRFIIDWTGLQTAGGEWGGLWSIDTMRLNRQIMDACRIACDRGWEIEVAGPVSRARAPLFRTVSGIVHEIDLAASSGQGTQ